MTASQLSSIADGALADLVGELNQRKAERLQVNAAMDKYKVDSDLSALEFTRLLRASIRLSREIRFLVAAVSQHTGLSKPRSEGRVRSYEPRHFSDLASHVGQPPAPVNNAV